MNQTTVDPMTAAFAKAFEEWLRRYNADQDAFLKEYGDPSSYGAGCAEYFTKLLNELSGGKPWATIAGPAPAKQAAEKKGPRSRDLLRQDPKPTPIPPEES
jgi:hypothetical protein